MRVIKESIFLCISCLMYDLENREGWGARNRETEQLERKKVIEYTAKWNARRSAIRCVMRGQNEIKNLRKFH